MTQLDTTYASTWLQTQYPFHNFLPTDSEQRPPFPTLIRKE